ncbi:MAG: acyl-CoA thioesterase [Acidobacteriia bacterium]|nr:acyl-CoA thioesterase [Terriglobia bacterium]
MAGNSIRPMEVSIPVIVRSYDIDFAGIVSNIVYVRWMEDLRMKFLEVHSPLDAQMAAGFAPALTHTEIFYRRITKLFDPVIGKCWVEDLTRATWTLAGEFTVKGEVVATARQSGAFIRLDTGRPVRTPLELREKYARALAEARALDG